jgi:Uncharacterized protein conserved in bacteria
VKRLVTLKALLLSLLIVTLNVPLQAQEAWMPAATPKREYRAVWLTTIKNLDWPSVAATTAAGEQQQRKELCAILDTLQAVGINTVLLQTRLRGDVIYPSLREPTSAFITGKEGNQTTTYDPLRFAIDECHKRGMQCHAWMVALQVKDNQYVNPASAAVVSHLCDMVREVVRGYDVDGIHLDYLRYPERSTGQQVNKSTRQRSNKSTGNDAQTKRDNVTACLRAVYRTVKAEKPWVCVSTAPLGKYRSTARASSQGWNAYNTVYQEAQEWLHEGICDALFPMMYYDGGNFYPFVDDWAAHTYGRHFAAGLGIYQLASSELNWSLRTIRSQMNYVRNFGNGTYASSAYGYALFRAGFIMNNTKGIRDELRYLNASPALVPAMTWHSSSRPDSPSAVSFTLVDDSIHISWAANKPTNQQVNKSASEFHYNLYCAVGKAIDIDNASCLYLIYQSGPTITVPRLTRTQDVTYALTAIDRYGNESRPVVWHLKAKKPITSP